MRLVLFEPMRMMLFDPVAMIGCPPVTVVPFVMLVPIAIVLAPIRMARGPFRVVTPEPFAIMLVPPSVIAPLMLAIVCAPSIGYRDRTPIVLHRSPNTRMLSEEFVQLRMRGAKVRVVNQFRTCPQIERRARMPGEKFVEALI